MARWDYHRQHQTWPGLSEAELAVVRQRYPGGTFTESVHHLPRVPGDDETDHIMRHKYGVDPATYRATIEYRTPSAPAPRPAKKRVAKKRSPRRTPVQRRALSLRLSLSRLVKLAIKESPGLASTLDRLVASHLRKGAGLSRARFIGLPLTIISTSTSVRVAFASER